MAAPLQAAYSGVHGGVEWCGVRLPADVLEVIKNGTLRERLFDLTVRNDTLAELHALATTEMATELITELVSTERPPLDWEIGEALAEALLETHYGAIWPWNQTRDRRTPKASLPGADLVGFLKESDGSVALLFGEVKTSRDARTPPNVLTGRGGMIHQLEDLSARRDLHFTLLRWLKARCADDPYAAHYKLAVQRFVSSGGKDFRLVGCLMRDIEPNQLDIDSRAASLSGKINAPTSARLVAWYISDSILNWPTWLEVPADD